MGFMIFSPKRIHCKKKTPQKVHFKLMAVGYNLETHFLLNLFMPLISHDRHPKSHIFQWFR